MKSKNILLGLLLSASSLHAAEGKLLNDFEGEAYAPWKTSGSASGDARSKGSLPGQMKIEGTSGRGFVSSFDGGDGGKGKLDSPEFKIEHGFITFLLGGGGW